jgi:hypothetical protein
MMMSSQHSQPPIYQLDQTIQISTYFSDLTIMPDFKPGQRIMLADLPVEVLLDNILPFVSARGLMRLGCTNKVRITAVQASQTDHLLRYFPSFSLHYATMILCGNANCRKTLISRGKAPLVPAAIR